MVDFEPQFANNPREVAAKFLEHAKPHESNVKRGSEIIVGSHVRGKDVMGVCIDVCGDRILAAKSTPVFAELFVRQDPGLPESWKTSTEIMRVILSMAASIDLGYLEAIASHQGNDVNVLIPEGIHQLRDFRESLHAQVPQRLGREFGA